MTTTEQENKELVREFLQAFNREDKELIKEILSDEAWETYGWEGRDPLHVAFPDHTETIEHIIAEDDMVAVRYRFTGTHQGAEYRGVPPTGTEVSFDVHAHCRIKNGHITEWWEEKNVETFYQALGVYPESITESRIRNQLLEVMLRVLRHNISNDLNAVTGFAEMIAGGDVPSQEYADRIKAKTSDLQATAEKVREIEQAIIHKNQRDLIHLEEVIGSILADQRDRHPEAKIDVTLPDEEITINSNPSVLSVVLEETIENAVIHTDTADPKIGVHLSPGADEEYAATITVADNGPGIPEHELRPVERGSEDPLEHGSGIGLWAIKWGVEQLGGEVEFRENDPSGSVVEIRLGNID